VVQLRKPAREVSAQDAHAAGEIEAREGT
jgi:hypothetical protein